MYLGLPIPPFHNCVLLTFFCDACFQWDDAPAKLLEHNIFQKFPSLIDECTPINWGLNTPQNVSIYLGASVCIYFCENCVPSDASVDMPKWLMMGAKGLSKKSCNILA